MPLSAVFLVQPLIEYLDEWKHGRFADYIWHEQIDVSVTTLDQLINEHGIPAYCKIDV